MAITRLRHLAKPQNVGGQLKEPSRLKTTKQKMIFIKEKDTTYRAMIEYLERQEDEKASEMLNHIKALKTQEEFNAFRWDLKHKALLNAF